MVSLSFKAIQSPMAVECKQYEPMSAPEIPSVMSWQTLGILSFRGIPLLALCL